MKEMVIEPAKSVIEGGVVGTSDFAGSLVERSVQSPTYSTMSTPDLVSPQDYLAGIADHYSSFLGSIPTAAPEWASGFGVEGTLSPTAAPHTSWLCDTPSKVSGTIATMTDAL
jgi:hypothetical protein